MEHTCITCPGLGRDDTDGRLAPNHYDYRYSCEECRPQLHGILHRIPRAHALLDATPGNSHNEHVTGTTEAPLGVRLAVLDELYTGPSLTNPQLPTGPDQDGTLPTARILRHIANAWLPAWQQAHPREHLPTPTVTNLAAWLDHRLDWALNTLDANIGDHAAYLASLARRLDRLNDPGTSKPEPVKYVTCPDCDHYSLVRLAGDFVCTANNCRCRLSPAQFERWSKLSAEAAKQAA